MIRSLLSEYGFKWLFNRLLYSGKLKMMRTLPITEKLFEKKVNVKRLDIFDINVKAIENFLNQLSDTKKQQIINVASNALNGKILGFSSIELDYGNPINWHLNPITKKIVDKNLKWYLIPDFDPERGDIKAIWEASRFTHFYYFVRAYMITKDKKYYLAFSSQLEEWLVENVYSYGPNYKCGQEATLRMINTLIAYSAFKEFGLVTNKDKENVKKIVEGSYKKVLSNFFYAHKCIKNNHTLSEITGLIIGAWACQDENKLKKAYILLEKEIANQFHSDGGYRQYSFNYQRFALQLIEFIMKISKKTGVQLSNQSKELIIKSANLIYQMQDETGDVPNYGSNDGALIFPVTSCSYRDFRPVVNTIFALIEGCNVYEPGDYDEEILWFHDDGMNRLNFVKIQKKQKAFSKSGLYSLRHVNGFLMTILQNYNSRPAQMDQLHIDLWHKGVNVLCDSGTYSYATEIGKRMSLTSAHNTVKVSDKEQMKKYGPFLIYKWSTCENVIHNEKKFEGTMISKNGYKHKRKIEKNAKGYSIVDEVYGQAEFCEFYFHTPCDIKKIGDYYELYIENQLIGIIRFDAEVQIIKKYRSIYYLKKEEINCFVIKDYLKGCKSRIQVDIELV